MNKTTTLTRLFGFDPQTMNVRTEIIAGDWLLDAVNYRCSLNWLVVADCVRQVHQHFLSCKLFKIINCDPPRHIGTTAIDLSGVLAAKRPAA